MPYLSSDLLRWCFCCWDLWLWLCWGILVCHIMWYFVSFLCWRRAHLSESSYRENVLWRDMPLWLRESILVMTKNLLCTHYHIVAFNEATSPLLTPGCRDITYTGWTSFSMCLCSLIWWFLICFIFFTICTCGFSYSFTCNFADITEVKDLG